MVRVPLRDDVPEVEGTPSAERVWTDATGEFRSVQPFNLPAPRVTFCSECDGRGREHDCPNCTCICDECDGSGRVKGNAYVTAGKGVTMDRRYAEIIMKLPGVEIEVADPSAERVHFRFDGGEGVVMLMRGGDACFAVADLLEGESSVPRLAAQLGPDDTSARGEGA